MALFCSFMLRVLILITAAQWLTGCHSSNDGANGAGTGGTAGGTAGSGGTSIGGSGGDSGSAGAASGGSAGAGAVANDAGSEDAMSDASAGLPISDVFVLGHSLTSSQFPNEIKLALSALGMTSAGVISQSGATAAQALPKIVAEKAQWSSASTIVMDFAINGGESGAEFKSDAEALVNAVRAANPKAIVVWVEAHACDTSGTGAKPWVQDRWKNKNPEMHAMLKEGTIDGVVPWAEYAMKNASSFYAEDCVHHYGKQDHYAEQIAAYLNTLRGTK